MRDVFYICSFRDEKAERFFSEYLRRLREEKKLGFQSIAQLKTLIFPLLVKTA
jgi:hypothetical protein